MQPNRKREIFNESNGNSIDTPVLSIVVPVYNEKEALPEFHRRLAAVLATMRLPSEIIYVNDGPTDVSMHTMQRLRAMDGHIAIVNLSRNFGKEVAITAGLDHALGEAAVVIDADLQDPPEVIPLLVDKWRTAYERAPRLAGEMKWIYWRLWNFATEGITSFTIAPLRLATHFGLLTAIAALTYALFIAQCCLALQYRGYASLMVTILFLAGVQLIAMGVGGGVCRTHIRGSQGPAFLSSGHLPHRAQCSRVPGTKPGSA